MTAPAWLSEGWVQASGEVLAGPGPTDGGASGVVAVEVTGAAGGSYWRRWADGVPVAGGAGKPAEPPDLTLGLTADEAQAFWGGSWSPSVAFMRGQLKVAGDTGLLFALLAAAARPDRAALLDAVEAATSGGSGSVGQTPGLEVSNRERRS